MAHPTPTLAAIAQNPTLHPLAFALVQERFPTLKWHSHADSPDSSQCFALSAFVPLLTFTDKNQLLNEFVTSVFPALPAQEDREWDVFPEYTNAALLGETGLGTPTNVDVLLVADDAVVCVESKFRVDAREGFGTCGQATSGACRGFHGAGSDAKTGTGTACRLEFQDGRRDPRRYWSLGRAYFQPETFVEQVVGQTCPYRQTYQLMRNYLTAAVLARSEGKPHFGALGIVPTANDAALAAGVDWFRTNLLPLDAAGQVRVVHYEDYVDVLATGSLQARALATYLKSLLHESEG